MAAQSHLSSSQSPPIFSLADPDTSPPTSCEDRCYGTDAEDTSSLNRQHHPSVAGARNDSTDRPRLQSSTKLGKFIRKIKKGAGDDKNNSIVARPNSFVNKKRHQRCMQHSGYFGLVDTIVGTSGGTSCKLLTSGVQDHVTSLSMV